ncbi:protein kinase domain-containing protein [Paraliomyxa miuraensis]|uniref:protein kinase domain-containing protein n=1 Tax=Paraliomyxa miuraensis TaxID=376150 RepID=UPI00224F5ABD|nr:protein kinase [Paraliomyxa miuraensis]MCX4246174.1 protein kinase [Paraliomyxa miuraensis]
MTGIGEILFGRYRIDAHVGDHDGVQLYRGSDLHALAPIHIKLWPRDEDPVEALLEGEAMAAVRHPRVVRLVDFGLHEGRQPCLVLEGVRGQTLTDRLKAGPLSFPEAFELGAKVLEALAVLHDEGLVHGNVTPDDVVLLPSGEIKLTGLSHVAFESAGDEPIALDPREALVQPQYKAPEQLAGTGCRPSADLYALGVVLCEAIMGENPFADEPLDVGARVAFRPELDELPVAARFALDRMTRASMLHRETDARQCARRLREAVAVTSRPHGLALAGS